MKVPVDREYEVLLLLGSGKRAPQIAERLRLSPKTIRTYRARIVEKMCLKSTAELIYYVISQGLAPERGPQERPAGAATPIQAQTTKIAPMPRRQKNRKAVRQPPKSAASRKA